jgi:hypothetical protein
MVQFKKINGLLLLLFVLLGCTGLKAENADQRTKVALRNIGHEFLLQLNDSTSRILPVEKIGKRYAVRFERKFSFEPDFLFSAVYTVLKELKIEDSYVVEVEQCDTVLVIHSFVADLANNKEAIACKLREVPPDCYVFYFTVMVSEKATKTESNKEVTETKMEGEVENAKIWPIVLLFSLLGGLLVLYYFLKRKRAISQEHLISIGQFQFDQKGMKLNLKAQSIELSSKETDLLHLLYSNENKTLEREEILNKVWGDEGDYVGRTLDVFISKLRKKLEADSNIKIINVRGVGYRFVIN